MNCPARTDEFTIEHPTWNQNPPELAADLTTRKDLNGTVNSREHDNNDFMGGYLRKLYPKIQEDVQVEPLNTSKGFSAYVRSIGLAAPTLTAIGGEDHCRPQYAHLHYAQGKSPFLSWAMWASSLLFCSALFFSIGNRWNAWTSKQEPTMSSPPKVYSMRYTRASSCAGSGGVSEDQYNTPLHIGALFIIWFVSSLACSFPTLAARFPGLRISDRFFFAVRHFGTGVLIATAFVHLLPTAFISLGDPCLSGFWTQDYPAMPGAIALAAIFFVVIIEMIFHPARHIQQPAPQDHSETDPNKNISSNDSKPRANSHSFPVSMMRPIVGRKTSIGRSLSATRPVVNPVALNPDPNRVIQEECAVAEEEIGDISRGSSGLTEEQKLRKDMMQCILLEVSILFHSVFIGMALSVSVGSDFVVLLIAIAFHQTFEGLALGSRIASIAWPKKTLQPWLMALAYGCTTPIGQGIGLALHSHYSPDSEVGLVLVGIMNAISSGLLAFASLVELLSEDFLSDESWKTLRGLKRVLACFLVFLGAFFMSLVGAWA